MSSDGEARDLRIVQLFPDLLSVYGDSGNLRTLELRARWRGIGVEVHRVTADDDDLPSADLFVIGGGQDRDQARVEASIRRISDRLATQIESGATLLAICGGYQSLGVAYRTADGRTISGPGILDVVTVAASGRLVGPVVARLVDPIFGPRRTLVGFENHSGRTELGPTSVPLARLEHGHGNDGRDGTEGVLDRPGVRGMRGLRIGSYLHGPLLPRNPHVADALLRAALARRGQPTELAQLDDASEWAAHDAHLAAARHRPWTRHLPGPIRTIVEPGRGLIGF